jgi:hypothetical protein
LRVERINLIAKVLDQLRASLVLGLYQKLIQILLISPHYLARSPYRCASWFFCQRHCIGKLLAIQSYVLQRLLGGRLFSGGKIANLFRGLFRSGE